MSNDNNNIALPVYVPFDMAVLEISTRLMPHGFLLTHNSKHVDSLLKITQHFTDTGKIKVWQGDSANTIFAHAHTNHCFRAWHDFVHIAHQYPFTLQGEIDVCRVQQENVRQACAPEHVRMICRLLEIEIVEQVKYYLDTGKYVKDQHKFTVDMLKAA